MWGSQALTLDFAGGPYQFEGLSKAQAAVFGQRFREVRYRGKKVPSARVTVMRFPAEAFGHVETQGWNYQLDFDYARDRVVFVGIRFVGMIDLRSPIRAGLWTSLPDGADFCNQIENLFRILVSYRLAFRGGALIHSAAVASSAGALLFAGHSGAGKSTLSRMALQEGFTVLSDDMNALEFRESGFQVERVPFAGDLANSGPRETLHHLRAILALEKGDRHSVKPISKARGVVLLTSCAPFLNRDPYRVALLQHNLDELVRAVPCHALCFSREPGLWSILEDI